MCREMSARKYTVAKLKTTNIIASTTMKGSTPATNKSNDTTTTEQMEVSAPPSFAYNRAYEELLAQASHLRMLKFTLDEEEEESYHHVDNSKSNNIQRRQNQHETVRVEEVKSEFCHHGSYKDDDDALKDKMVLCDHSGNISTSSTTQASTIHDDDDVVHVFPIIKKIINSNNSENSSVVTDLSDQQQQDALDNSEDVNSKIDDLQDQVHALAKELLQATTQGYNSTNYTSDILEHLSEKDAVVDQLCSSLAPTPPPERVDEPSVPMEEEDDDCYCRASPSVPIINSSFLPLTRSTSRGMDDNSHYLFEDEKKDDDDDKPMIKPTPRLSSRESIIFSNYIQEKKEENVVRTITTISIDTVEPPKGIVSIDSSDDNKKKTVTTSTALAIYIPPSKYYPNMLALYLEIFTIKSLKKNNTRSWTILK